MTEHKPLSKESIDIFTMYGYKSKDVGGLNYHGIDLDSLRSALLGLKEDMGNHPHLSDGQLTGVRDIIDDWFGAVLEEEDG